MAVVVALVPDLLFGSKVQAMLAAAGHDVRLVGDPGAVPDALPDAAVLVVDLTIDTLDGAALVASLRERGELGATRTLGFYSHVDQDTRGRAEAAGFDLVIPRSRMAREGDQVVARLAIT